MSVSRDDFGIAFRSALLQRGASQKFSILSLIIVAIIIFFQRIFDNTVPSGFASIFVAVTVFSGVILIALGVIGEYIGRIFLQPITRSVYHVSSP